MQRAAPWQKGFTLLETLFVIGCVLVLVGIAGGAVWHVQSAMLLRSTATEFVQAVKTARQFAIDQRCRTRIAFRPALYDGPPAADTVNDRSYQIFAFIVPAESPGDRGQWMEVTAKLEGPRAGSRGELVRLELSPRPEGMVGRWILCPLDSKVKRVPDTVKVTSPLFERFTSGKPEEFFDENFYTPESVWALTGADPHEPENCVSVFPANYWETPIEQSPVLLTGEIPEGVECYDPISREVVEAVKFWPGTVQYFGGMNSTKSAELPGIEFNADGSLACLWTKEIEIRFASVQRPETAYTIIIDAVTGLPRIVDEEV